MSVSYLEVEDIGRVKISRRRGLKNIRVSINNGEVRLSIPWYVPKKTGLRFLQSQKDWIRKHKPKTREWSDGHTIAKDRVLKLHEHSGSRVRSATEKDTFNLYIPTHYDSEKKQSVINKHVSRFMVAEGERILVPLADRLADSSGYKFSSVSIRSMKSRWGSCNHKKKITLNTSLLNLPDDLAEYVVIHELIHTRHLNHSSAFWQEVEDQIPDYKQRRKKLKSYDSAGNF